jgi:hypothetical protein
MTRDQLFPDQDDCVQCTKDYYLLKPVRWQGPGINLPKCIACPTGATCPGVNIVEAKEGFWRLQTCISRVDGRDYEYLDDASDVCQVRKYRFAGSLRRHNKHKRLCVMCLLHV